MKVLVAGHCCIDITPELPGTSPGMEPGILYSVGPLKFKVGGSAPNSSGTLQALGADVEVAVTMGDDELGHICWQQLDDRGAVLHWTTSPFASSYSIVVEHGSHDRTFWQHEGSNASFDPRELDLDGIAPDLLHPAVKQDTERAVNALVAYAGSREHTLTPSWRKRTIQV